MARKATGTVIVQNGKRYARITIARKRPLFLLETIDDDEAAAARTRLLADLAFDLRSVDPDLVVDVMKLGAAARAGAELDEVLATGRRLAAGELVRRPTSTMTFRQLGEMWTKGELADRWPDHVRRKAADSATQDRQRLERRVYPIVGSVRLVDFTLEHAELVLRALPPSLEKATRRQYAQLVHRVMALAVYPARLIGASPIPRNWLPKLGPRKARSFLYPDEDRRLLACVEVPLAYRLLYGFLAREGMRKGEVERLVWRMVDFDHGTLRLDWNKTDAPRTWALDAGVLRALRAVYELRGRPLGIVPVFVDEAGAPLPRLTHVAKLFREHLRTAKIDRAELFERSARRIPIVVHDLRATFVTLALAAGRSEAWISDRTGHTSSVMIRRYQRSARTLAEMGAGELEPLDAAIPELASIVIESSSGPGGDDDPETNKRRDPEESRRFAEERTRTSTPFRAQEPESDSTVPRWRFPPENWGDLQGRDDDKERGARAYDDSEAGYDDSRPLRSVGLEVLGRLVGRPRRAADEGAGRVLERALRELLDVEDRGDLDGADADVIDLASRRRREP